MRTWSRCRVSSSCPKRSLAACDVILYRQPMRARNAAAFMARPSSQHGILSEKKTASRLDECGWSERLAFVICLLLTTKTADSRRRRPANLRPPVSGGRRVSLWLFSSDFFVRAARKQNRIGPRRGSERANVVLWLDVGGAFLATPLAKDGRSLAASIPRLPIGRNRPSIRAEKSLRKLAKKPNSGIDKTTNGLLLLIRFFFLVVVIEFG